ncbi:MAG: cyclic nucleotide-binding domain-containing protein, partial [Gaiellaceae bacterium]
PREGLPDPAPRHRAAPRRAAARTGIEARRINTQLSETEIVATLGASSHLAALDQSALVFLIRFGNVRQFAAAEALMRQGEPSTSVHFILTGEVSVERQRRSDSQPVVLARLGSGEIVGEMGVLVERPRSATVIAVEPTTTLELDAASFHRAARAFPILHRVLAKLLSERLRRTSERVGDERRS